MRTLKPILQEAIKKNNNFELDLSSLDESQYAAVTSEEHNVLLRASAGSGKTKSLIAAIAAYRYENINDRICAITYTRAARAEMEQRLQDMGIYDVEVTTIHVWARNLLQHYSIQYGFKVQILEEKDIKLILFDLVSRYTRVRNVKVNLNILYSFITGNKNMDITDGYRKTLKALEDRYIQYKRNNLLYDFMDYPLYLYDIMRIYNETIEDIDALFVDEFQDVDAIQFDIFQNVHAKKKFFVGDSWQSIFVFRGADGEVFKKVQKDNFANYKLMYNYRSYQEIVNYACTVYQALYDKVSYNQDCYIAEVFHSYPCDIICSRGYGGTVTVISPWGELIRFGAEGEIDISTALKETLYKRPMILCRTNKQVRAIQDCGYSNVSTVHQAKGLEYNDVIIIDSTIDDVEDLNVAYVALTRARNSMLVINWQQFELLMQKGILQEVNN